MNDNIFTRARSVGIENVLEKLGARRAGGRGIRLLYHCPFREDRNPSMYVNVNKGTWVDMANPEEYKGDGIKLVELTLNLRPLEAAQYIVGEGAIASTTRPQSYTSRRVQRTADSTEFTVHELEHPALLDYLNSVCNLEKVVEHFNVFGLPNHIQLWLDNDDAGRNATIFLTEKLQCDIEDMSSVYASYNDVNDWLVATK